MTATTKLQVILAQHGIASRRKAEVMIEEGRVTVNGEVAHIGQRVDSNDKIIVNGQELSPQDTQALEYYLVNKPIGLISTTSDELSRQTILSLLPRTNARLYPVGRLDKESEGLMILTNDGDVAFRLTHPRFEVPKRYKVLVSGHPTPRALEFLKRGVKLKEGMTSVADVEVVNEVAEGTWLELELHEGRYHHVRRMLQRAGYETIRLIRLQMGLFTLKDLHGKKYHRLEKGEIAQLYKYLKLKSNDDGHDDGESERA